MKRKIKLTESDLHNIIKESVNHILSELDWRTYQSAYEKSLNRDGSGGRTSGFRQAATNSFNRQNGYGLKNVPYGNGSDQNMKADGKFYGGTNLYTPDGDSFWTGSGKTNGQDEPEAVYNQQQIRTNDSWRGNGKRGNSVPQEETEYNQTNSFNPSLKYKQMKGDKEVRDYFNGKSKYVKGKGWK